MVRRRRGVYDYGVRATLAAGHARAAPRRADLNNCDWRYTCEPPMPTSRRIGPITHLVSDCDGVLIDSEAVALDALLSALQPRFGDGERLVGLIRPLLGRELAPLLVEVFGECGADASEAELAAIRALVEAQCDLRLALVPGVASAMAAIALPKAVASNSSSARVHAALGRTGLAPLFGARIYTPDLVGSAKPHPGVYLAAAGGFDVAPGACAAVEDSVTGVTAAAAAGMYVLGFTGGGHIVAGQAARLRAAGAHATFDAMAQLPGLIDALTKPRA